jgi:hypothetical protein
MFVVGPEIEQQGLERWRELTEMEDVYTITLTLEIEER